MKFWHSAALVFSWLLVACGSNIPPTEMTTSNTPTLMTANHTPIAAVTLKPMLTRTPTLLPTVTTTPTLSNVPELGGSQAWIEKNFKPYGFQFTEPYGDGERIAVYGNLVLQKNRGDLYDMEMQILTTNIGYALVCSELLVVVKKPLIEREMSYVLELFRLLWATSTNSDGTVAADWINTTLPALTLNTDSKKDFGIIKTRIQIVPVAMSDSQENLGYSITLWVDPASTTVGEAAHISVEAVTPLEEGDRLTLSCWDYEDPATVTWSTSPACVPNCASDNPNVFVSNTKIMVYEGFPVTYDQWSVKVELDPWRQAEYPPYTYQFKIVFHGKTYTCTNSHEFIWNNGGEAGIFVEMRDGEQNLWTDDPVGMLCVEE